MATARMRTRKREHPYVLIDHSVLNDTHLSFRAKGLHAYLLAKPDNWVVHISQLVKVSPREGRDAILSAIKELENAGYIRRQRTRNAQGKFIGIETLIYETPELAALDMSEDDPHPENPFVEGPPRPGKPDTVLPDTVLPYTANPPLVNKDSSKSCLVVKKEKKESAGRDRDTSKDNGNGHGHDDAPPTPAQQDEALASVKPLLDKILGRSRMPPAEEEVAAVQARKAEQLARAKAAGILAQER